MDRRRESSTLTTCTDSRHSFRYGKVVNQGAGRIRRTIELEVPPPGGYRLEHVDKFFPVFCEQFATSPTSRISRNVMNDEFNVIIQMRFKKSVEENESSFYYNEYGKGRTVEEAEKHARLAVIRRLYKEELIHEIQLESYKLRKQKEKDIWQVFEIECEQRYQQMLEKECWYTEPPEWSTCEASKTKNESQTSSSQMDQQAQPEKRYEFPFEIKKLEPKGFLRSTLYKSNVCEHRMVFHECFLCQPKFNFFLQLFKKVLYSANPFESGIMQTIGEISHDEVDYIMNPGRYCQIMKLRPVNKEEIRCTLRRELQKTLLDYYREQSLPLSFLFRR
uniref:DRBM domain-containing protein n=1 Tax=Steinernema glaseri TaxID=37863 RepID=A0A1I7Y353_9BILA